MKKALTFLMAALLALPMFAGCADTANTPPASESPAQTAPSAPPAGGEQQEPAQPKGVLMMATTTSTDNTGLLDI